MAKKFFYVCAGVFLLSASYQFGARSAVAQSGGPYVVGSFVVDTDPLVIDASGQMWMMGANNSPGVRLGPVPLPKPGAVLDATCSVVGDTFQACVLYADGDAYKFDRTSWHFLGNVVDGGTNSANSTWGQMKARYR
jgi:hypothetical protein